MRCYICNGKDDKDNMQKGDINYKSYKSILTIISGGFISDKYHYFHKPCMESVICEPEVFTSEEVDRALECHDFLLSQERHKLHKLQRQEREAKLLKSRITLAQSTLECLR